MSDIDENSITGGRQLQNEMSIFSTTYSLSLIVSKIMDPSIMTHREMVIKLSNIDNKLS